MCFVINAPDSGTYIEWYSVCVCVYILCVCACVCVCILCVCVWREIIRVCVYCVCEREIIRILSCDICGEFAITHPPTHPPPPVCLILTKLKLYI